MFLLHEKFTYKIKHCYCFTIHLLYSMPLFQWTFFINDSIEYLEQYRVVDC